MRGGNGHSYNILLRKKEKKEEKIDHWAVLKDADAYFLVIIIKVDGRAEETARRPNEICFYNDYE